MHDVHSLQDGRLPRQIRQRGRLPIAAGRGIYGAQQRSRTMKSAEAIREQIAALEAELRKQEEAEAKAAQVGNAKRAIALLAAMRAAMKGIEDLFPGTFEGEKWSAITPQAWPRDTKLRRAADLSETEVDNARAAGKAAIDAL